MFLAWMTGARDWTTVMGATGELCRARWSGPDCLAHGTGRGVWGRDELTLCLSHRGALGLDELAVVRLIFWRGDGEDDMNLFFGLHRNIFKYYENNHY